MDNHIYKPEELEITDKPVTKKFSGYKKYIRSLVPELWIYALKQFSVYSLFVDFLYDKIKLCAENTDRCGTTYRTVFLMEIQKRFRGADTPDKLFRPEELKYLEQFINFKDINERINKLKKTYGQK